MTPTIKPVPTTCMAISSEMPNRLQARGTRRSEPPATPDAPQALAAESTQRMDGGRKINGYPECMDCRQSQYRDRDRGAAHVDR